MTTIFKRLNPVTGVWEERESQPSLNEQIEREFQRQKEGNRQKRPSDYGMGCQPTWIGGLSNGR